MCNLDANKQIKVRKYEISATIFMQVRALRKELKSILLKRNAISTCNCSKDAITLINFKHMLNHILLILVCGDMFMLMASYIWR